ncbi:MAG: outer membrane protein transport protein [Nitrospirae bacterium]|nr:outer membrane protein transport protein [Nitrospirota bacterium]
MKTMKWLGFAVLGIMFVSPPAFATNGMNLEGYGPVATGVGGASMAYDNGTFGMMNNPATLGLGAQGDRLDVALSFLGPNVTSKMSGMSDAKSSADLFIMPGIGYVKNIGMMAYGLGIYAQGGMGTEYAADSFMAAGSGDKARSELSVGRLVIPFVMEVDKKTKVAVSLEGVWAGLDLKMPMSGTQFMSMMPGQSQTSGTVSGTMISGFQSYMAAGMITGLNWGRFDFSNSSDFTGEARGYGVAAKVGGVHKVNDQLTLGAAYHSKTALGDLESDNAKATFNVVMGGAATTIPVSGKIAVKNFEWPQTIGLGAAFQATKELLVVADYKWINWKNTMKNFAMTFTADSTQSNAAAAGFAGSAVDATLFQNWKDQNVFMVGLGYKVSEPFTVRAGANIGNNPIPDTYLNALFPAIVKNHYTLGAGYAIDKSSGVDAALSYAPEVKATAGSGVTNTHSQKSAQVMYSYRF